MKSEHRVDGPGQGEVGDPDPSIIGCRRLPLEVGSGGRPVGETDRNRQLDHPDVLEIAKTIADPDPRGRNPSGELTAARDRRAHQVLDEGLPLTTNRPSNSAAVFLNSSIFRLNATLGNLISN